MRKRIGDLLMEKGLLTQWQVNEIVRHAQKTSQRFGEAGVSLGFYTPEELQKVFGPGNAADFFYLEPAYFPQITRELFNTEDIMKFGALPLGFKTQYRLFKPRKILNVGLLNPSNLSNITALQTLAKQRLGDESYHGLKIYLILPDQLLDVLSKVYGFTVDRVRTVAPADLDETLHLYIESGADQMRTNSKIVQKAANRPNIPRS